MHGFSLSPVCAVAVLQPIPVCAVAVLQPIPKAKAPGD